MTAKKSEGSGQSEAGGSKAAGTRAATERIIERAALRLLGEHGVLAGLNLREVADEAGVNRGLVYHYFGSRRVLLRSALRREAETSTPQFRPLRATSFALRGWSFMREMVRQSEFVRLVVILKLDNDERVRVLPGNEATMAELRDRQAAGEIWSDLDLEAFHLLQVSSGFGYALLRESMAKEMGGDVDDLDRRVADIAARVASWAQPESERGPHSPGA